MKLFFQVLLFISTMSLAQNKKRVLLDYDSKLTIEQANIDFLNGNGTYTNNQGIFYMDYNIQNIKISCIGYETLELNVGGIKDTIFLVRSNETLNEISVKTQKRDYKKIFPKRGFNDLLPENFGKGGNTIESFLIKAVFIPNEADDSTKIISKIIIHPVDYRVAILGKNTTFEKRKDQKYAPFKINLYTVDTVIGIPVKRIFDKDITVQLKEGEKHLTYELPIDKQISFPKQGVFIAISSFAKEYYNELGFETSPAFLTIGISDKSQFKVFRKSFAFCENDENCKWFRDQYMWDRKNTLYVGLEIY